LVATDRADDLSTALADVKRHLAADPAKAEALVRDILRENPDDPDALLLLAIALRKKGAANSARALLETLVQRQSHVAPVHYELGLILAAAGDNRGATAALRSAVDLDPGFAEAWHALGDQMTRMRSKKVADKAYAEYYLATINDPVLRDAMAAYREGRYEDARQLLRPHVEANPADVNAIKLLAEVAMHQNNIARAEQLFKRCVELAPDFTGARFRYATALMSINKLQEAIDQVDEILRLEPDNHQHRNLKAAAYLRMSAFAEAAAEYEIMLKAAPNQPGAWISYGHALKSIGKQNDAIAAYKKAASLLAGYGDAYWGLANLKTYKFSDIEIESMRQQLTRKDMKGENRGLMLFALGKAFEDQARYEESFMFYREANELLRAIVTYDPDETASHVRRSKSVFTRALFEARASQGSDSRDPIFVVGMPRSGSTLIEQILASHSEVEGTTELRAITYLAGRLGGKLKPTDIAVNYPEAVAGVDGANLKGLGEEYLWRAGAHRVLGKPFFIDKMPNNFAHIGLIQLILPNAKIIDVRRHPLACCFSNFKQHFGTGQQFSYSLTDLGRYYADYVELMAHWDDVLPGKVHRVFYEDLIENPEIEIRRLLDHVGLAFEDACLRFYENDRIVRTASSEQVRKPIFTEALDHWRHYEPWLGPLKSSLGFVLEKYPTVPQFYSRVHAKLDYAGGWNSGDARWSGQSVQAATRPASAT
jgi:tetratricopeptide (TPR) repeat protein